MGSLDASFIYRALSGNGNRMVRIFNKVTLFSERLCRDCEPQEVIDPLDPAAEEGLRQ